MIRQRQAIAALVVVIVVILFALLIHSCDVSSRNTALRDYNDDVGSLVQQSDQLGQSVFRLLTGATSARVSSLQQSLSQVASTANSQYHSAQRLSVPSEMQSAQQDVLLAFEMRRDAAATIAQEIQPALSTTANQDAINEIATQIAVFYASDVVYTDYATHRVAAALHAAGIAVGGPSGQTILPGQIVTNIQWLQPSFVSSQFSSAASTSTSHPFTPGLHGHALNSVDVSGTMLTDGATIPVRPAPTFTLNFTNGGNFNEFNVVCKVSVSGTGISGQTVVPETFAHKNATCNVKLSSPPPAGGATVVATIEPVRGETNIANNTLSFAVTFQ